MMPERRVPTGINRELISFAVTLFEAAPSAVRTEQEATEASLRLFQLATWVLGGLRLVRLLGGHLRAKRSARISAGEGGEIKRRIPVRRTIQCVFKKM